MKVYVRKAIRFSAVSTLILGIAVLSLHSQVGRGKEQLKGVVVDEENKPIEGAVVVVLFKGHYKLDMKTRKVEFIPTSTAHSEVKLETKTDSKGKFRFIGLGYGQWEVTATYGELEPGLEIVILQSGMRSRPLTLQLLKKVPQIATPSAAGAAGPLQLEEDLDEETKKILKDPKKLFELGEQFLLNDELENAVRCFYLASRQKPGWSAPYLKMGYAYFNLGLTEKALEFFNKFLELDPKSPEAPTVREMVEILKDE